MSASARHPAGNVVNHPARATGEAASKPRELTGDGEGLSSTGQSRLGREIAPRPGRATIPDHGARCVARALAWLAQGLPGAALSELIGRPPAPLVGSRRYPFPPPIPEPVKFRAAVDDLDLTVRGAIADLQAGRIEAARSALASVVEPAPADREAS